MNKYPDNPSSNHLYEITRNATQQSKERRDKQKYDEHIQFAKKIAALAAIAILGPFGARKIDENISYEQDQSAKYGREAIKANPQIETALKIASGEKVEVRLPK